MREVRIVTNEGPPARCVMPMCEKPAVGVADVANPMDSYDYLWPMCEACCIREELVFLRYSTGPAFC